MEVRLVRVLALVAAVLAPVAPAVGQPHPVEHLRVPYAFDSGSLSNRSAAAAVVFDHVVQAQGAPWVRLTFNRVDLATGSFVRLTSLADGAVQHLHAQQAAQWANTSAYFNGAVVRVELVAGAGTAANRVEIGDLYAGTIPENPESECGPTDDRVSSSEPERARLLDIGCTASIYNTESCFITAGHCSSNSGLLDVVQFNVPLSNPDRSLNHPPPKDQYAVDTSQVVFTSGGIGNDWGLFRVFPNSETGLLPFEAQGAHLVLGSTNPPVGDEVNIVGYGVDDGVDNQTQQSSFGPITTSSMTTLQYRADTEGGNSGSSVVWEATGEVVAVHTHGGCTQGGGANSGTAITNSGLQSALDTFCPVTGEFTLTVSGTCPGTVTVMTAGGSGTGAVLTGSGPGSDPVPAGPCAGVPTGLADPRLLAGPVTLDLSVNVNAPQGACGKILQVLEVSSCALSNTANVP